MKNTNVKTPIAVLGRQEPSTAPTYKGRHTILPLLSAKIKITKDHSGQDILSI